MTDRRAFIVGIDKYDLSKFSPDDNIEDLGSSANDATRIQELLLDVIDPDAAWDEVNLLTDSDATSSMLGRKLGNLFSPSSIHHGETELLFYFSGHAVRHAGLTTLAAHDGPGYSLTALIQLIEPISQSLRSATVIIDSCFSGDIAAFTSFVNLVPMNAVILTATRDRESGQEIGIAQSDGTYRDESVFSSRLIEGLSGAAADLHGAVSAFSLFSHASAGVAATVQRYGIGSQAPMFKANTHLPIVIRRARPRINLESLRQLPVIFPDQNAREHFKPSHDGDPDDDGYIDRESPEHKPYTGSLWQIRNDRLKDYRNAGLLETYDNKDFWHLQKGPLRTDPETNWAQLTELGKYYWYLAKSGRFEVIHN